MAVFISLQCLVPVALRTRVPYWRATVRHFWHPGLSPFSKGN